MNKIWQSFLATQGGALDKGALKNFSSKDNEPFDIDNTYLCDLSHLGLISAKGEDVINFLHGQFTNDLKQVTETRSQLSSYCNPKGRLLSIFRIFKQGKDYFLLMRRDVIETTLKRLTMFKLMAKVELSDASDEFVVFGIAGPNSDSTLKENNLTVPVDINESIQEHDSTIIRIASENSRLLFISKPEDGIATWKSLCKHVSLATSSIWDLHDIQSGIAQITADTIENFIPQMVNLDLINGVNFQKGCYPGQEIVARTHYLGKPNRRMYHINISDGKLPAPGTNIFSTKDGDQPVGKIVTAQSFTNNSYSALAVLRTAKENDVDLHVASVSGPKITFHALPYSLQSQAE